MRKKVIICEIGMDIDTPDDTIVLINKLLKTNANIDHVIYVDTFVEEIEEDE